MSADELLDRLYPGFARRLARLRRELLLLARTTPRTTYFQTARWLVAEHEPLLAATIGDRLLLAYLAAARDVARQAPALARGGVRVPVPSRSTALVPDRPTPRLAMIEAAADWLASRRLVSPEETARLGRQAEVAGFALARTVSSQALATVHEALIEDV